MSILKNFTIIDLVQTRSASVATITGNTLKLNPQTAVELHYAPFVQVLVNPKGKQFAIRVCKEDDSNAVAFSKDENAQKGRPVKITSAAITDIIRKMAKWSPEENWNVPGIFFAEDDAIVYDINTAYSPVPKGGWSAKKKNDAAKKAVTE